jgi:hypothetical protein
MGLDVAYQRVYSKRSYLFTRRHCVKKAAIFPFAVVGISYPVSLLFCLFFLKMILGTSEYRRIENFT